MEIQMGYVGALQTVIVGEITGLELSFPERARALLTVRGYDPYTACDAADVPAPICKTKTAMWPG